MSYFVFRPDHDGVAGTSLQFAKDEAIKSGDVVKNLTARVNNLHKQLEGEPGAWWLTTRIGEAETALETATTTHDRNLQKLEWELRRVWMQKISRNPAADVKPWSSDPEGWAACFKPRKNLR